jgi:hypothetical protein
MAESYSFFLKERSIFHTLDLFHTLDGIISERVPEITGLSKQTKHLLILARYD